MIGNQLALLGGFLGSWRVHDLMCALDFLVAGGAERVELVGGHDTGVFASEVRHPEAIRSMTLSANALNVAMGPPAGYSPPPPRKRQRRIH